ncbi:MAG: LptF/LptG family permease, partial [Planctomycetes bacterium]|nr:LptF/LptG family permease [Planctomycetota bacterium]
MMILDRYLRASVLLKLALVSLVFTGVFAAYSAAVFLSRAAAGLMKPEFVLELVALKAVIALEVILPIALYAAVILSVARLRRSEEATAMQAVGFGNKDLALALAPLFIVVALGVGFLSLSVRPDTYTRLYELRREAEAAFDLSDIEAGQFYSEPEGNRVVFAGSRSADAMKDVFVWNRKGDEDWVIRADELVRGAQLEESAKVEAKNLRLYKIDGDGMSVGPVIGSIKTGLNLGVPRGGSQKRKAKGTTALANSDLPEEVAEFQWRVSRVLSTLMLAFLALRVAGFTGSRWGAVTTVLVWIS